jgi:hypothetical protein
MRQIQITKNISKVVDLLELYDCEIVSYGLAPRPNGFCFERGDDTSDAQCVALSKALDSLTSDEEQLLRILIFGGR